MEKRVFFLTPQVIMNDLSRGTCPAVDVRCLVIDEAHKATGNHAYCQVIHIYIAQVVVWSSGTAAVQAIRCHDITVAWVRIPAREEPKICESKFTDLTLLG